MQMRARAHVCVCVHACACVCMHGRTNKRAQTGRLAGIPECVRAYMHKYIHTYMSARPSPPARHVATHSVEIRGNSNKN